MSRFFFGRSGDSAGKISEISATELKTKLDEDNSLLLIDVRTLAEYETCRVPHIKARYEYHEIAEKIDHQGFPKDQPIYLICRVGRRSMVAAKELAAVGYERLINIAGGTTAWLEEGYPVIKR